MNTINKSLMRTWYLIIIGLPLCVIILFNIFMRANFDLVAKKELKNTTSTMRNIMTVSQGEESDIYSQLAAALTSSRMSANTSFYILRDEIIVFSSDASDEKVKDFINKDIGNKAKRIKSSSENYYVTKISLDEYEGVDDASMVFATKINDDIIWGANIILVVISILCGSVCFLFSYQVTKKISVPIEQACDYAKRIGDGEFMEIIVNEKITEINNLYNSFNHMSKQLREADEHQKKVYQNISHEFRNPLMSIQGYSEGIEKGIISDTKGAAGKIRNESLRLNDLVSELLMLSRMDNENYKLIPEECSVEDIIIDCMESVNGIAINKGVKLSLKIDDNYDLSVDIAIFSRAIKNVLTNCIKYAESSVKVHCYEQDARIIDIYDDGEGISEKDMPHLFERFYKGEKGNFGLGLAITYEAVELHGGSIEVIPVGDKTDDCKNKVIFRFKI